MLERERYGATSFEIGAALLERNELPRELCAVVASQGDDELSVVVRFARRASQILVAGDDVDAVIALLARAGVHMDSTELVRIAIDARRAA